MFEKRNLGKKLLYVLERSEQCIFLIILYSAFYLILRFKNSKCKKLEKFTVQ